MGEIDQFEHSSHGVKAWHRNKTPLVETGFDNTLFGMKAAKIIAEHDQSASLVLFPAVTAPHSPCQAPQEALDRYAPLIADQQRHSHAAMVLVMDHEIGRVLAAIDAAWMRQTTLIVFQSGSGGVCGKMFLGEAAEAGDLPANNGPYREGKGTLYEGGTRVVGLVNWPGQVPAGEVKGMIHGVDIYPTLVSVAGAGPGLSKSLDGMDVWDAIAKGEPSPRTEVVCNVGPLGGAVRQAAMRLVGTAALPERVKLFDLSLDPGEAANPAYQQPEMVKKLQDRIEALAEEMAPPLVIMTAIKTTYGAALVAADPGALFSQGQD